MNIELLNRPSSTVAKITFENNQSCTTEAGAMVAMRGNLRVETTSHKRNSGNLFKAFKRMLTGESFFLNHFYSQGEKAELWLSHPLPGDMEVLILNDSTGVIVSGGSFVASSEGIESDLSWQGMKGLFSGENIFWLKMSGQGSLIVNCYGTIYTVDVDGEYIVDTGHVVAFEETLNFEITKAGSSWLHSFLGGEGLVMRFKGHGKVWCQSHNPNDFGKLLGSELRPRQG